MKEEKILKAEYCFRDNLTSNMLSSFCLLICLIAEDQLLLMELCSLNAGRYTCRMICMTLESDGTTSNEIVLDFRDMMTRSTDGMLNNDFCHISVPNEQFPQHFGVGSEHVMIFYSEQIAAYLLLSPHAYLPRHISHNVTRARTAIECSNSSER